MLIKKRWVAVLSELNISVSAEFKRLHLLENAVINYGGGRDALESRAINQAKILRLREPATAALLDDIARYLHDVAYYLREAAEVKQEERCHGSQPEKNDG